MKSALAATLVVLLGSTALGLGTAALIAQPGCTPAQGNDIVAPGKLLDDCILQAGISDIAEISDPWVLIASVATACAKFGVATADGILEAIESYFAGSPALDATIEATAGVSVSPGTIRLQKVLAAAKAVVSFDASVGQ